MYYDSRLSEISYLSLLEFGLFICLKYAILQELKKQVAAKQASLPQEPLMNDERAIKIMVRMPDGYRQVRRFHVSNPLQVYLGPQTITFNDMNISHFVISQDIQVGIFSVRSNAKGLYKETGHLACERTHRWREYLVGMYQVMALPVMIS